MNRDEESTAGRFWNRWMLNPGPDQPGPQHLAGLRRGLEREPGSAPEMWRWYTQLSATGTASPRLKAEHAALGLFGIHQQGQSRSMNWKDVSLGTALHGVRRSGRFSEQALDRRVAQAATATDLAELVHHLKPLITMMRGLPSPQGLDYDRLERDFRSWQWPEQQPKIRRRLGGAYFAQTSPSASTGAAGKD